MIKGSLPVRECGLKSYKNAAILLAALVTPRAGVWIEIAIAARYGTTVQCHSPCGSVD